MVLETLIEAYPIPLMRMTVGNIKAMPLAHLKWKVAQESFVKDEVVLCRRLMGYEHLRELCFIKGMKPWELDMMVPRLRKTQVKGSIFCDDKARVCDDEAQACEQ